MSWVLAFLAIAALILLHEFGHFAAAKLVGMRVEKFSLFFGPMFVKKQIGETVYGIGVIPLGGYVKISGMTPEEEFEPHEPDEPADDFVEPDEPDDDFVEPAEPTETEGESAEARPRTAADAAKEPDPRAYVNMAVWKRVVVILAGPVMNLVVAFVILTALFLHYGAVGKQSQDRAAGVQSVLAHSSAATVLKKGDQIVSVDGLSTVGGITRAVDASHCAGQPVNGCVASPAVSVVVRRAGRTLRFALHPRYDTKDKRPVVGFSYDIDQSYVPTGVLSSAGYGVKAMWEETTATIHALSHIFQAKDRKQLHSIVGISKITEEAVSDGPEQALEIIAAFSLALALINLFPFLPLDGGHIFWALAERVTGRKVSLRTIERASIVGLGLVLILVAIGMSNDVHGILNGGIKLR